MDRRVVGGTAVFDDLATQAVQTALAGLGVRQRVTADNIANLETAGFTANSVAFESSLAAAVQAGQPASASITQQPTSDPAGVNGNNVNLASQLVSATQTQLQEQLMSGALTSQLGLIATVLKG
jgi:flagellar basal-body rod protein FlgB